MPFVSLSELLVRATSCTLILFEATRPEKRIEQLEQQEGGKTSKVGHRLQGSLLAPSKADVPLYETHRGLTPELLYQVEKQITLPHRSSLPLQKSNAIATYQAELSELWQWRRIFELVIVV
ncbi:hypothetical protein WA026_022167 [Henosepilachna vigintioctopunctata]|uniref:Uncharacterized protein n=1 Tax=Henosepilachna vigintioctopunctata TaxID=420089 RepID=A0AAW1U060_9CUCU